MHGRVVSVQTNACSPGRAGPGRFIAEVGIVTGREALGMRVGFVGVGRMGQPVCANLVRAGYVVTDGEVGAELESMAAGWGHGGRRAC
jgi:hypothetical protein